MCFKITDRPNPLGRVSRTRCLRGQPMKKKDNLSPIEKIRQAEAEITRQIAAARETAEGSLQAAKIQAERLHAEAIQQGKREGEKLYRLKLDQAREAAAQIVSEANKRAVEMRQNSISNMDDVIQQALYYLLNLQTDQAGKDEH